MSIQVKEVHKFDKGIQGSVSETDISPEAASLSLNIDPNSEYGALRGIYGDKILSNNGWEPPRHSTWYIEFFTAIPGGIVPSNFFEKKYFVINAYDKIYLLVFCFDDSKVEIRLGGDAADGSLDNNIGLHADLFANEAEYDKANADDRLYNVVPIMLESYLTNNGNFIKVGSLADGLKTTLEEYTYPSETLQAVSGFTSYFVCNRPNIYSEVGDLNDNGELAIYSRFLGAIGTPFLPTGEFPVGGIIPGWRNSDDIGLYLPDHENYDNPTRFIQGNGFAPGQSYDGTDGTEETIFDFIKIKAFNSKGSYNILGITKSQQVQLLQNIGLDTNSNPEILGPITISSEDSVSIEQRNKNLYIGAGDIKGSASLWMGYVSRSQLGKNIEGYQLEKASLETLSTSTSSFDYDNIVIPTLHHGLNSTNGGLAGAASLYCDKVEDTSDVDKYKTNIDASTFQRSVNGWVRQCIKNISGSSPNDYDNYIDFKLGMILRVNLGDALVAGDIGTSPTSGLSAYSYLRELKQIAKGDFTILEGSAISDEGSVAGKGGSGEVLHDGDLFQIVFVPDAGLLGATYMNENNSSNMFRLAYVGSLFGKADTSGTNHPSYGNSTDAYCGIPAYGYAHIDDGENLHRIKLTSRSDVDLANLASGNNGVSSIATNSSGVFAPINIYRTDSINLRTELGISDFVISTIAECKSCDGEGNFGGDTTNKNYFTGHGKLWIANKHEHNAIYLVDVSNWNEYNKLKPRISFKRVELQFSRIHSHLISDADTNYGNGLIRLWEQNTDSPSDYETEQGYFADYNWDPEPLSQYVSSICETYSHLPHLGDGAGGGDVNGDGKWRVWVEYKKDNDAAHTRYDLFLFNFRPQEWTGVDSDSGTDLNGGSLSVWMFDKTPPYQECQKSSLSDNAFGVYYNDTTRKTIYYPFDKFAIKDGAFHDNGFFSHALMHKDFGSHHIIQAKPGFYGKLLHNESGNNDINAGNIQFRNPSGELHTLRAAYFEWFADSSDDQYNGNVDSGIHGIPIARIYLGTNLGWVIGNGRQYNPVRHTLKSYYKKWYFTGNSIADVSTIPHIEEDNYKDSGKKTFTAHVVSSFGKVSGHFVRDGGSLISGRETAGGQSNPFESKDETQWFSDLEGELEHYDDQYTMFTLHDSPVAIETYGAANNAYEVQGKPMLSASVETIQRRENNMVRKYHNDTEAGFMGNRTDDQSAGTNDTINHSSVSATMGYGVYNQYRMHHKHNGTHNTGTNTATTGENESYEDSNTYGYGGQYHGQDGFGHYINITQTWACNQDYLPKGNPSRGGESYIKLTNSMVPLLDSNDYLGKNARSHGWGDGAIYKSNNRRGTHQDDNADPPIKEIDGTYWAGTHFDGSSGPTETFSRHGTGYFTYGPNQAVATDNLWDEFYSETGEQIDKVERSFKLHDYDWHNRRIVHCWSTTCLTDSIHNYNFGTRESNDDQDFFDHREWGLWKTPRCSFRKLIIPSIFGNEPKLKSVDTITWSDRNVVVPNIQTHLGQDQVKIKSGFILSFILPYANISDLDNSATGVIVYETKNSTFHTFKHEIEDDRPFEDTLPFHAHSRAAIDFLRSVYFSTSVVSASEDTINSNYNIYSNTKLLSKNIVPGLSDDTSSIYSGDSTNRREQGQTLAFHAINDVYSPVALSQDGSEPKQTLGIWYRAQFEEPNTGEMGEMTTRNYPYYVFDRLWNYWSKDESETSDELYVRNEDTGFDRGENASNEFITEGWGSTAGVSANFDNADDTYPTNYEGDTLNSLKTVNGAHVKINSPALLSLVDFEPGDETNPEFPGGKVYYKFSFLYDGFQESPLSFNAFPITLEENASLLRLKLTVSADSLEINTRVTHLNIYRRNNSKELYRLVKSVNLNLGKESWGEEDGYKILNFNDEERTASYEGINGIPESLHDFTPNYRLSCQLNDFLFIGGIYHNNVEEGDHLILRSKQGRFSVFDWSNDFLDIPTKPIAMASFANRIWVFDSNNIYKINPTGLYIENRTEGIGILNSESFIVTDMGMFWCDRNNIYKHDGEKINQIGTSILKNHANPEWQIGYLDAVNKSEKLGYTPKIGYDPINQCIYISLQGFSKSLLSYRKYDGRIYSYDIKQDRWDYYDSPAVKTMATDNNGDVLMSDGFQIYNFRRNKKAPKSFSWDSKSFQLGSANYKKTLKTLKFNGDLCLWRFNNSANLINETALDDLAEDIPDFDVGDDTHLLELTTASEDDDLKVYVDGILQTMRIRNKNPVIGTPIANDSTGEIYKLSTYLPNFGTKGPSMTYEDSFSLDPNSCPEFLTWPNSQFQRKSYEGEFIDLLYLHRGMYIYFKGTDIKGLIQKEVVRIRDIKYNWLLSSDGLNELNTGVGGIEIRTWRGQLGTKAYNWGDSNLMPPRNMEPMRPASPTFLFPRGLKGNIVKISLQNQKSFIDSFAMSYRLKRFK